jgi:glycosyltransferase involved in cell wall biosynthesis
VFLSIIVSTYQKPDYLERVLWGYAVQTRHDFELVVADDGSGPETAAVVRRLRGETGMRIVHVWHEDRGFRKSTIVNRAIRVAEGDYLLFTDGDSIPRADLVAVHYGLAEPGRYVAGGYLKLPAAVSAAISVEEVRTGRATDVRWLRAHGWRPGRRALRLGRSRWIAATLDLLTPTRPHFAGNNASVWRSAIEAVNGFDMDMVYGGLDRAVGYRLENLGVRGKQVRHRAVCVHLHHDRPYRDKLAMARNRRLLQEIRRSGSSRTPRGLAELTPDSTLRIDRGSR